MAKSLSEIISGMRNIAPAKRNECHNCSGTGVDPIEGGSCMSCSESEEPTNNDSGINVNSAERSWGVMGGIAKELSSGEDVVM